MIRSGFKRPQIERKRTVHTPVPEHLRRAASFAQPEQAEAITNDAPARSEPYRRLVAAMPCANCGRVGRSQHAHENGADKARGMKQDDRRAMPLCADDYGVLGCHTRFDRYALFLDRDEHRRMGALWSAQTRVAIEASGQWPKNLPRWTE
jgi:hypothetical protein